MIRASAPNFKGNFLFLDTMNLYEDLFSGSSEDNMDHLSTTKGRFPVIGYYGNEIRFFNKIREYKGKPCVIIIQKKTIWIEEFMFQVFEVENIKDLARELTFENIITENYGISFNFNKFTCEKGHSDVELISRNFNKITEFIEKGTILDKFTIHDVSFDARNSGQIILHQLVEQRLNNLEELYEFLLYNAEKLDLIYEYHSLVSIFLNTLEDLGIEKDSLLPTLIREKDLDTIKRIIELILIKSIYQYLEGFPESPVIKNLAEFKIFSNVKEYADIFQHSGSKDFINNPSHYLDPGSVFSFKGIEPYIRKIELKEFIEPDTFPQLQNVEAATGIFQFEWNALVKKNESLEYEYLKIKDHFNSDLFDHHFMVLDAWHKLHKLTIDDLITTPIQWQDVYDRILVYEFSYQRLKQSDIQNRVLSRTNKKRALDNYRNIIQEIHDKYYYPGLKNIYRDSSNLVSESLSALEQSKRQGVLIVFDGMRSDFWKYLKRCIEEAKLPVQMEESYRYAVIPTITEVSRHSIFTGNLNYNIREEREFPGNFIFSEADFYQRYDPDEKLTGIVIRFIDNRIHISSSVKGEFVDYEGIINDFKRYVKTFVIPMLRHIFSERSVEVVITSDHGFVDINKEDRILDKVYDETFKGRIRELIEEKEEELGPHTDMFLVSPDGTITQKIENRFGNDVIIIRSEEYGEYNIPKEIGGDALVFPKIYKYLWNGSLRYNHGSLSIFETMVPFVRLY